MNTSVGPGDDSTDQKGTASASYSFSPSNRVERRGGGGGDQISRS